MTNDQLDDQIQEVLHDIPERWTLAEDGVDSSVQQEYLEYTKHLDFDQYSEEDIAARSHSLFSPNTPPKDKKEILAVLAHRGTVKAYRIIERFLETAEQALVDWGVLALQECRMFLESSLSHRNIGMLVTGLGGKDNRLRYFLMIHPRSDAAFTVAQEATIKRGFSHICSRFNSILENVETHQRYATMMVLVPLDVAVAEVIERGIDECNTFCDLLDANYYVRNDRIPTEAEILHYLQEIGRGRE